jgi:hypothetical protein
VVPQRGRVAEARPVRDGVDGLVALLEQLLGQQDALPDKPALRRRARVLDETAGEGPLRHVRARRQLAHREGLVEVDAQPFQQVTQASIAAGGDGLHDVLRLAAVPVRRHHHPPGDAVGDPGTLLLPDQVQAGVDAGRGARAGDHRIVVDVEDLRIHLRLRVTAGQLGRVAPVRGTAAAVKQAGLAQDEGSAAHAQDLRAAAHRPAQGLEQDFGKPRRPGRRSERLAGVQAEPVVTDRRQGNQVRLRQTLQAASS